MAILELPVAQRCATCRHWKTAHAPDEWGKCALTRIYRDEPEHDTLAYVVADYAGVLRTAATFGCVQWSEELHGHS
jgi:disulfide oxidoreductase YuzD